MKIQTYGFRANLNMLGFFDRTKASRWAVNISPLLGLVGTKASYRTLDHNEKIKKRDTDWHFGAGGNLGAEFKITHHFSVGIYSGITFITGQSISGLPKFGHKENYFWESGVRLNVIFGKSVLKEAEREIKKVERWMHRRPVEEANVLVVDPATDQVEEVYTMLEFPIINFPTNSDMVEHNQAHKINKIVRMLQKHPNMKIVITGYADDGSNKDRCRRRATQRAQAVQRQLLHSNINPEIITIAVGDDNDLQQKGNCVIIDKWEK